MIRSSSCFSSSCSSTCSSCSFSSPSPPCSCQESTSRSTNLAAVGSGTATAVGRRLTAVSSPTAPPSLPGTYAQHFHVPARAQQFFSVATTRVRSHHSHGAPCPGLSFTTHRAGASASASASASKRKSDELSARMSRPGMRKLEDVSQDVQMTVSVDKKLYSRAEKIKSKRKEKRSAKKQLQVGAPLWSIQ